MTRLFEVRIASGVRETLESDDDATNSEVLEMLRDWARQHEADEIRFTCLGRHYRFRVDFSAPVEVM